MAIQYNFLTPIDQKVRDQGYDFVSQNKYLQDGFVPTDGISYEGDGSPVSYANSMGGIMSQAPIIYPPIINQGGGGGGGPPTGPAPDTSFDYETEAYGLNDLSATEKGLTEEEQEALDNQIAGPQLGKFGTLGTIAGMFTAPLTTINFHRMRNKRIEKELEEKTRQAGIEADFQREAAKGNSGAEFTGGRYDGAKDKASYDKDPTSYSGSSKDGGLIGYGGKSGTPVYQQYLNGGRAGYFFGGRVNYKVGGRTDAESQYGAGSVGSYDSSANQSDRKQSYGNNNPPVSTRNDNKIVTTDFISKDPNLTIDYTDPRNYTSVYGKIGFNNILDNDDLTAEGNVTGEFGPIGYNTNFTDKGITGTNLTAGNFNANISPDMQVQNIGYNNNINGINYGVNTDFDNTMFTAGVNFKNGGLASIL